MRKQFGVESLAALSKLYVEAVPKAHEPRFRHLLQAHHDLGVAPKLVKRASMWRALMRRGLRSRHFRRPRSNFGRVTSGSAGTCATNTVAYRAFATIRGFCCYARSQIWDHGCCRCWKNKSATIGRSVTVMRSCCWRLLLISGFMAGSIGRANAQAGVFAAVMATGAAAIDGPRTRPAVSQRHAETAAHGRSNEKSLRLFYRRCRPPCRSGQAPSVSHHSGVSGGG